MSTVALYSDTRQNSRGDLSEVPRAEDFQISGPIPRDAVTLDRELERITETSGSGVARVRRFAQAMLARGEDAARVQVRADLWADLLTQDPDGVSLAERSARA